MRFWDYWFGYMNPLIGEALFYNYNLLGEVLLVNILGLFSLNFSFSNLLLLERAFNFNISSCSVMDFSLIFPGYDWLLASLNLLCNRWHNLGYLVSLIIFLSCCYISWMYNLFFSITRAYNSISICISFYIFLRISFNVSLSISACLLINFILFSISFW